MKRYELKIVFDEVFNYETELVESETGSLVNYSDTVQLEKERDYYKELVSIAIELIEKNLINDTNYRWYTLREKGLQ